MTTVAYELMAHQQAAADKIAADPAAIYDTSDTGTGKTLTHLHAWHERRKQGGGCLLVLAPKTILQPAWGNDIEQFFPHLTYVVAYAKNRQKAFDTAADIYITNLDAVSHYLQHQPAEFYRRFDSLVMDEATAFKNPGSGRSKACRQIVKHFKYRAALTGTPYNVSVTEMWGQVLLLDDGNLLGQNFYRFRSAVQTPVEVRVSERTTVKQWKDKPHVEETLAMMLGGITVRNVFEECLDIPEQTFNLLRFELGPRHRAQYDKMREEALIWSESGDRITAVHAGALANKLLQLASGAVYNDDGEGAYSTIATERYELIAELVAEEPYPVVVFFQWRHQREELKKHLKKREQAVAFIDGTVPDTRRGELVDAFQDGHLDCLLLQVQAAAHGLTLTRGRTVIHCGPIRDPGLFRQTNARIYRKGQAHKTKVIMVAADGTCEAKVYKVHEDRKQSLELTLELFAA